MNRHQLRVMSEESQEVDFKRDVDDGLCSFCRKPIEDDNGTINFYSEVDGALWQPGRPGGDPVALFAHSWCGPNDGMYFVQLAHVTHANLGGSEPGGGLLFHLRSKSWWCKTMEDALFRVMDWRHLREEREELLREDAEDRELRGLSREVWPRHGGVYFVQTGGANGAIKIGRGRNIAQRISELQTAHPHPLRLLGFIAGDGNEEKELHIAFSEHRLRGEWFKAHSDLIRYIELLEYESADGQEIE